MDEYERIQTIHKHGPSMGQQEARYGRGGNILDESITQSPRVVEKNPLNHAHFGHPEQHPVGLRHRKKSADPLHGQEDKLLDEWKELFEKANQGQCSPGDLGRLRQVRASLDDINVRRKDDARKILEDMIQGGDDLSRDDQIDNDSFDMPSPDVSMSEQTFKSGAVNHGAVKTSYVQKAINTEMGFTPVWKPDPLDAVIMLGEEIERDLVQVVP